MTRRGSLRTLIGQWVLLALALAAGGAALEWSDALGRIDRTLYDLSLRLFQRPAPDDIAIVAVDEASLAELGRWPWSRARHAELLARLKAAGARAVALDLMFTEPEGDGAADRALAQALLEYGRAVLPVFVERAAPGAGLTEARPLAVLEAGAHGLGHINGELDMDGIARGVFLREGLGAARWPHMVLALLEAAGTPLASLPGERRPAAATAQPGQVVRDHFVLVPFAGGLDHFRAYSYSRVLKGEHDAELRGRLVLVGATAAGLGDVVPTPVSRQTENMPGVEFQAHLLDALRNGTALQRLSPPRAVLLTAVLVLLPVLLLPRLTPRRGLIATWAWVLAVLAASLALLRGLHLWWGPSEAILGILTAYPLWSWRRLEYTVRYMDEELARMRAEPHLFAEGARAVQTHGALELIEERVDNLRAANARMRSLRRFISDSLEQMADAMLVSDPAGQVLMSNRRASELLSAFGSLEGVALEELLAPLAREDGGGWEQALAQVRAGTVAEETYARHRDGRDLLVGLAPFHLSPQWTGVIVTVSDVTPLKESERRRATALRFLSHDLRAPLLSILATADTESARGGGGAALERVRGYAESALALADAFLELARAESAPPTRLEEGDLAALAHEAADDAWALAQAKGMRIERRIAPGELWLPLDAGMMRRCLANLIGNAIKYSPAGSTVTLSLAPERGAARCCVADQGIGIPAEDLPHIFEPFRRVRREGEDAGGLGLGLAFVRLAAQRHGGHVEVQSEPGKGSAFCLVLPLPEGEGGAG